MERGNNELSLKLTALNMVEMDGPGQSNAEDGVMPSIVVTLAFLLQRSGASTGKTLLPLGTTLNLLFFLGPSHFQFSFSLPLSDAFGFRANAFEDSIFLYGNSKQ